MCGCQCYFFNLLHGRAKSFYSQVVVDRVACVSAPGQLPIVAGACSCMLVNDNTPQHIFNNCACMLEALRVVLSAHVKGLVSCTNCDSVVATNTTNAKQFSNIIVKLLSFLRYFCSTVFCVYICMLRALLHVDGNDLRTLHLLFVKCKRTST